MIRETEGFLYFFKTLETEKTSKTKLSQSKAFQQENIDSLPSRFYRLTHLFFNFFFACLFPPPTYAVPSF